MCSIEEAWAGQNFDGKKVVSQGDLHNSYMSLPDNILIRNDEFAIKKTNQAPPKNLPRGVNSKLSREPRVPKILRNTNNADINISSEMPEFNNYGGLEPLPSYMSIYNNSNKSKSKSSSSNQNYPMPVMTGEHFTDIENAYTVSDTLNNYMATEPNLLEQDTPEEISIINNKFTNMNNIYKRINNTNRQKKNNELKYDNSLNFIDPNSNNNNNIEIKNILNNIIKKIDNIEIQLNNYNNKNIYDLILYIIIGILFSFCIYSIFNKKISNNK